MRLAEFLFARIAEEEALAREATLGRWRFVPGRHPVAGEIESSDELGNDWTVTHDGDTEAGVGAVSAEDAAHIVRWRQDRVLAECAAKQVVEHAVAQLGDWESAPN
jgi:hypothetical protein